MGAVVQGKGKEPNPGLETDTQSHCPLSHFRLLTSASFRLNPTGGHKTAQPTDAIHTNQPPDHPAGKRSMQSEFVLQEQMKYTQLTGDTWYLLPTSLAWVN